uniref:Uncharacterized protein n=1 Tax=Timema poppense TaxID=170557 RepID=A0A7R9D9H5_TIMPO|nr:unnamed protein product [Timema poppensis]
MLSVEDHFKDYLIEVSNYRKKLRVIHNALLVVYGRDILHELVNVTATPDWPAFCTRVTVNVFSRAVSALYVRQYSNEYLEELRREVTQVFQRLKATLQSRVRDLAWLDESTRATALKKLSSLKGQFSTWPQLWNQTYVDSLLEDVEIDPDNFFENVIKRYRQLRTTVPVDFHRQMPDEQKWAVPFLVNAFYEQTINSIVIPLAMLTQPYFLRTIPSYIRYATVGLVFSHEILHGFDLAGIGYDSEGTARNWFTPNSHLRLEARLDCVARQYLATFRKQVHFLGASVDIQFDWNMTRNENMADISGLNIAYQTWQTLRESSANPTDPKLPRVNLNPRQMFFLSAAQSYCSNLTPEDYILLVEMDFHTPYPERVNGMMMNSQPFAEAFNCPLGSPMNPVKKFCLCHPHGTQITYPLKSRILQIDIYVETSTIQIWVLEVSGEILGLEEDVVKLTLFVLYLYFFFPFLLIQQALQVCVIYAVIPLMLLQDSESDDGRSESIQIIRQNKQNNDPIEIFAELHKCLNLQSSHKTVIRNYSGPPLEELGVDKDEPHFQDEVIRCYRKIVITLKINGYPKKSSNVDHVIVDTVVIAGTQTKARLLHPIVLKVKQEEVLHLYELNFDTFVNGLAYEEVMNKEVANYSGCDDSVETPTCGLAVYHFSNSVFKREKMPYSQGFCCSCDKTTNSKRQAKIHQPKRSLSHFSTNYDTGDKSHLLSDSIKRHLSSVDRGKPRVRDELIAPLKSHLSSMEQSRSRGLAALAGSEEHVTASQRTKTRQGRRNKRSIDTREGQLWTEGDGSLNLGADTYWGHVSGLQSVGEAPDGNTRNRIPLIPFKGEEARSKEERFLADKADGEFKERTAFDGDGMSLEKRQVVHGSLQARGGQSCADRTAPTKVDPVRYHESAHCLRFSDLWYAVYSLKSPIIDHSIHFQAFQMARNANGTTVWKNLNDGKTVTLDAESQKYVTSDAKMSASYSSFHGDKLIPSLLDHPEVRILVPQPVPVNKEHLYPQLQGGPEEWLVLSTSQISLDGQDCNKAGVGFQAFYNQPDRCDAQKNACLNNQPLHFWQHDTRAKKEGRRGSYFLDNYCLLPAKPVRINKISKQQFLAVQVGGNQASSFVVEIAADDNLLVMGGMSGRLTEVHVDCTWADKCLMTILASNLDLMSSEFTVRLAECPAELTTPWGRVVDTPSQVIPPYHTSRFHLELWGALPVSTMHCSGLSRSVTDPSMEVRYLAAGIAQKNFQPQLLSGYLMEVALPSFPEGNLTEMKPPFGRYPGVTTKRHILQAERGVLLFGLGQGSKHKVEPIPNPKNFQPSAQRYPKYINILKLF